MVEHLKVLISRAPKGPYGRAPPVLMVEQLKFQFTYWVGGLTVEPLPVLWSSKKFLPFLLVKSWEQSIP